MWVVGDSPEENTATIQNRIIPKALQWERESGATFETDKTEFIHFTKEPGVRTTIKIKDDIKEAADEVKVL